jgi:hypothetical protein
LRWQAASGVLLAAAAIAAVVIAIAAGGGNSNSKPSHRGAVTITNVPIAPPRHVNLTAAAIAAGCTLSSPPSEGRDHVIGPVIYHTNPPSSGPHDPVPAHDGIYGPAATPAKEQLVHALEHGRVEIQYASGTPASVIGQLQSLVDEFATRDSDPRVLLFENRTAMPFAIAAVAWTHILGCASYRPAALDALRQFRRAYDLKAPEQFFVDAE